jgi:catechol 2,3-dioxygenase-like lactoylglutathione lyase family enzyme
MTALRTRRAVLCLLAASTLPLPAAAAPDRRDLLPVDTPGLDHLDVIVPDVEKSTRFYMGLFRTTLHAQPFQGAFRYFVLLGPLPPDRAVGYLAIGASRGRGTYIGHFCTSVAGWQRDNAAIFAAMKQRFSAGGFGEFAGSSGPGGIFSDPDGIEIQFLPAPDTVVTAAVPSDLVAPNQGLVTPLRVDHVIVQVSNLARAMAWYRLLYGRESRRERDRATFWCWKVPGTSTGRRSRASRATASASSPSTARRHRPASRRWGVRWCSTMARSSGCATRTASSSIWSRVEGRAVALFRRGGDGQGRQLPHGEYLG